MADNNPTSIIPVELGPVDAAARISDRRSSEMAPSGTRFHLPAAGARRASVEARRSIGYAPAPEFAEARAGSFDRRRSLQISQTSNVSLALAQTIELETQEDRRKSTALGRAPAKSLEIPETGAKVEIDDHKIPISEFLERVGSDPFNGLSAQERAARLQKYGPNALTPPKPVPWWVKLLQAMFGAFAILLWVAAVAAIISYLIPIITGNGTADIGSLALGIVLIVVNLISGFFTFAMEHKAEAIMASFKNLTPTLANVIVDGVQKQLDAVDLVPGDVVIINGGEMIPADCRVLEVSNLKVDMCSFTGETEALPRTIDATDDISLHSRNLCFYGTSATEGTAKAVIFRTGDATELGLIAKLASAKTGKKTKAEKDANFDKTGMTAEQVAEETQRRRKERHRRMWRFWEKPPIDPDSDTSPMRLEINYFVRIVAIIALMFGIICLVASFILYPTKIMDNILFGIGICVALVPEGLIITVTLSLALTAKRMADRNVLVKNMESIETLGSCSVIVSDKTGTLTQNKMTVAGAFTGLKAYDIRAVYNTTEFQGDFSLENPDFRELVRSLTLCSRAEFTESEGSFFLRPARGDASECALLRFAAITHEYATERISWPKLAELPFNSRNKFSASVHGRPLPPAGTPDDEVDISPVLYFKGAPERVLARCTHYMQNGERVPIDGAFNAAYDAAYNGFGGQGMRVLAFARADLPANPYAAEDYQWNFEDEADGTKTDAALLHGLTFVGLTALADPPRDEVPEAVRVCRGAHIRVVMATGDHPLTAQAIAKQIGLIQNPTDVDIAKKENITVTEVRANLAKYECRSCVIAGGELAEMDEATLLRILANTDELVLARMSPTDKLRVVKAFQSQGQIVASLGDGVNDSPHLSQADIGVAMNDGSQVTKDVADLILLDNSFASIVAGVFEGRLLFANVKKSIAYTLTSNIPELAPFIFQLILQMPLALTTLEILCIDLGTDLAPAISFTYEKAEADIMLQPPRDPHKDSLISGRMITYVYGLIGPIQALSLFACFLTTMGINGQLGNLIGNPNATGMDSSVLMMAQSAGFFSIIVVQIADAFICKTRNMSLFSHGFFNNYRMILAMCFEVFLGLFLIFVPVINTALGLHNWDSALYALPSVPFAVFMIVFDELRKLAIRKKPTGFVARATYY